MRPAAPQRTWDVLIVADPGLATDLACALHGQLARRDLRVKLDVATMSRSECSRRTCPA